jgi:putative phage-type endonuclease
MSTDRRGFIGGSDVPAILGVSPWTTPYELWCEKTGRDSGVDDSRSKFLRRGKMLEPLVIDMVRQELGVEVPLTNQRYTDEQHPWMRAEIDFEWFDEFGNLQNGDVKTVHPFAASEWGAEGTDEFPAYYCAQFQWGLGIKPQRQSCLVAALIGADDLRFYRVERDDELIAEIRRRALIFWRDHVLADVPPEPVDFKDSQRILSRFTGFVSVGSEEVWREIERIRGINRAIKKLESSKADRQQAIARHLLAEAEALGVEGEPEKFVINGPNGKRMASLSFQKRKAYTAQVPESSYWVFRT